ncbi:hypothetical protein [Hymenobacter negativus]|uniref:DUF2207 domain-containing protein n=1 Tax=Hymenobacter negativus TaxID=2795026 RepID=A0ABS3QH14_9BACT|nr:hypothetical protein [Hymenobacter negativus]MBO2010547.1 hypothetical protein [Hymenobacter negativus]
MALARLTIDDEMFGQDIVPAWERSFGIRFVRDEFAQVTTVGDVWAVVERHLVAQIGENPSGLTVACATQRTFYRLRRALMAQGLTRAEIVPRAQLQTLFPWRQRRRLWRELQQTSMLPLPRLRMSALLFVAMWAVGAAMCWGLWPGWGMPLIYGLAMAVIVSQLPWVRWILPTGTLGKLTAAVVADHYRTLSHPYVRNNLGEMRDIILAGLARCGVEVTEIDPDELYDGTKLEW